MTFVYNNVDRPRRHVNVQNKIVKILPYGVVFPKKYNNCSQNFQLLRLQAVITPQWLQIAGNSRPI